MDVISQCLGTDISAQELQICLKFKFENGHVKIKGTRKFPNTTKGILDLKNWLEKRRDKDAPLCVVMEATGVYYEPLAYSLHDAAYIVHVLLPNRIKAYLKFLNLKTKTDKIEAQAIAQLGVDQNLPAWKPASPQMYKLKRLCRAHNMLVEEKTVISNRLHAEKSCNNPNGFIIKQLKQRLNLLAKQIKQIKLHIQQTIAKDQKLNQRVEHICEMKGLAFMSVITIIAETNGFELVKHKSQLVSYAGYDVVERQSGSSIKGKTRISKKGNSHIRKALYFPALTVVKYNKEFKALFERVFERTKIKMKGYVAVQRKLLVLIYTLYKNNQKYDPQYAQKKSKTNVVGRTQCLPTLDDLT